MSRKVAFRRQPVDQQVAQNLRVTTFPAPTRGIIQSENEDYMQPGGAVVQDNWAPTMRGIKLRGGYVRWCDLHALDVVIPPVPGPARKPVISAFEYVTATVNKIYAANATTLYDVTAAVPVVVKAGQNSGNYVAEQFANAGGEWMIVCNEAGDYPLRTKDGITWVTLDATGTPPLTAPDGADWITGPAGPVEFGHNLTYVWKYRNRLFFIGADSMDAYYLDVDSVGGLLKRVPLAGAAAHGGKLLFGAVWSLDAGDGVDDKCCFFTTEGEALIFTGSNPGDATNWRQEGRYQISQPLGMNGHVNIGGDLMVLTVDGIIPISQCITKSGGQLELATLTRTIKPLWRQAVAERSANPWTAKVWNEYGAVFVAAPATGSVGLTRYCLLANNVTGAWARFTYGATCFMRLKEDMLFGTEDGIVMLAERTGFDDGANAKLSYVATLVGGWEMFGAPANHIVWHQARAAFKARPGEPFRPQLAATVDYMVKIPLPPPPGPDLAPSDVWDEGVWGPDGSSGHPPSPADIEAYAQWDQPSPRMSTITNTLWVSIGETGFAHAPIVQITVAQRAKPSVELVAISATYEPAGVNV